MEEWRVIPEFPEYEVSNLGNVRRNQVPVTLKRKHKGGRKRHIWYLGFDASTGIKLPSGAYKTKTLYVHKEVAKLWHGPRPDGMVTSHKDDNKENNSEANIEYTTHKENMKKAVANGKHTGLRYKKSSDGKFAGSGR